MDDKVISMVELATALCAPPLKQGVNKAEHIALREIEVIVYPMPELEPWPSARQAHLTDIGEIESMERAAKLNYKLSDSDYDKGRMEAFGAAVERLKERRYER